MSVQKAIFAPLGYRGVGPPENLEASGERIVSFERRERAPVILLYVVLLSVVHVLNGAGTSSRVIPPALNTVEGSNARNSAPSKRRSWIPRLSKRRIAPSGAE